MIVEWDVTLTGSLPKLPVTRLSYKTVNDDSQVPGKEHQSRGLPVPAQPTPELGGPGVLWDRGLSADPDSGIVR